MVRSQKVLKAYAATSARAAVRSIAVTDATVEDQDVGYGGGQEEENGGQKEDPGRQKSAVQLRSDCLKATDAREAAAACDATRAVHECTTRAVLLPASAVPQVCPDCALDLSIKTPYVRDLAGNASKLEVMTLKIVYDSLVSGRGYGGLQQMTFNLGLPQVHRRTFLRYCDFI